jgi:phage gp29-like protein
MSTPTILYGPDGQPIQRETLTSEIAGPSMLGMRSPFMAHPVVGLNPRSLAALLREADMGLPMRYFELAEVIEERDLHYVGVLGTRKRAVTQLEITVEAASDDPAHVAQANMVRAWLTRDELTGELFNILDAVGKGISYTEIVWDTSEGQWQPARLEWRDPRWFRFDQVDGRTPLLRDNKGDMPLPPFKFIQAVIAAKSGLPVRSGLARLAMWSWMFKAFTMRDWAIFTQTFGQPVRVGKYPPGTNEADKQTLFDAVANIAGDCAAIIPASMLLEFIESKNVGAGSDLYERRADWLDKQMSKAVLGQTATTDAVTGGLGSGKEHRQVQEDIERADCRALAAVLNRDLVRPWVQLEHGPQKQYPKLKIGRAEEDFNKTFADDLSKLVPMGLKVQMSEVRDRLGFSEPDKGAELLVAAVSAPPPPLSPPATAAQSASAHDDAIGNLAAQAERVLGPANDELINGIRAIVERCSTLQQVQSELKIWKPALAENNLAGLLRMALVMAQLAGRADIADADHTQ